MLSGQDIRQVRLESLRRAVAIVPQDTVLFNSSIRDNIAYGNPDASAEDIEQAIDLAHLRPFIQSLPQGDGTLVGERGLKVSGGEKQRIAIARVLLKRSPVLIFDEATSALDSHSESAILTALRELATGHTSLVIAHRLSTVTDADLIVVLAEGQVVRARHASAAVKPARLLCQTLGDATAASSANSNLSSRQLCFGRGLSRLAPV